MKDYNQMAQAVFRRRDEYLAEKKKKRAMLLKAGVPLGSLVLVALLGLTMWLGNMPEIPVGTKPTAPVATDSSEESSADMYEGSTSTDVQPVIPTGSVNHSDPVEQNTEAPNATQMQDPTEQSPQDPTEQNPVQDPTEKNPTSGEFPSDESVPNELPTEGLTDPVEELPSEGLTDEPSEGDKPATSDTEPGVPDSAGPDWIMPGEAPHEPEATEPVATEPVATEPAEPTDPTEAVDATSPATTDSVKITVGDKTYTAQAGDVVTYTAELYVEELVKIVDLEVKYSNKYFSVSYSGTDMYPNLWGGSEVHGYSVGSVSISGIYSRGYDFRTRKVLVSVSFIVTGSGTAEIDLQMNALTSKDGSKVYFSDGQQLISDGININEYLTVK